MIVYAGVLLQTDDRPLEAHDLTDAALCTYAIA